MRSHRTLAVAVLAHERWATGSERTQARVQLLGHADALGYAVEELHDLDGNPITDGAAWQHVRNYVHTHRSRSEVAGQPVVLLAGNPLPHPPSPITDCILEPLTATPEQMHRLGGSSR